MWAIIPRLRVARTIAIFGWLFSACCLLLVRLTMLELPLNFPTMSLWMVLKPPSRHSDFPRDFSNPNEFLFRWRMQTCDRMKTQSQRHVWLKSLQRRWTIWVIFCWRSKFYLCSNGVLAVEWCISHLVLIVLHQLRVCHWPWKANCPNCQRVMICDDFVEKVSACFKCWWSTSVFPTPIQTWLLALLNCQSLHFLARIVCVSFWSKNAGINDKNLGPYVSVLQRKWHGVVLLALQDRIEKPSQNITQISCPWIDAITCHHMNSAL